MQTSSCGRNLATDSSFPLLGKRILVTGESMACKHKAKTLTVLFPAPRQYASKLCGKLVDAGARALWVPGVRITGLMDSDEAMGKV